MENTTTPRGSLRGKQAAGERCNSFIHSTTHFSFLILQARDSAYATTTTATMTYATTIYAPLSGYCTGCLLLDIAQYCDRIALHEETDV